MGAGLDALMAKQLENIKLPPVPCGLCIPTMGPDLQQVPLSVSLILGTPVCQDHALKLSTMVDKFGDSVPFTAANAADLRALRTQAEQDGRR